MMMILCVLPFHFERQKQKANTLLRIFLRGCLCICYVLYRILCDVEAGTLLFFRRAKRSWCHVYNLTPFSGLFRVLRRMFTRFSFHYSAFEEWSRVFLKSLTSKEKNLFIDERFKFLLLESCFTNDFHEAYTSHVTIKGNEMRFVVVALRSARFYSRKTLRLEGRLGV